MKTLLEKLCEYSDNFTPFHMPGHKRKIKDSLLPYSIDITEVEGFDNLHNMEGVLKETAELSKRLYGAVESYPLVNGSTCGILAGIYALTRENKNVLLARNCHKSVYNAAELLQLNTYYVAPESEKYGICGRISEKKIEQVLKQNDIGLVVVTSPTYDGMVSDIPAIYQVCKESGAYLLVDGAHGAHFFDMNKSCDICVTSIHKTLPALTQTAILNIQSDRVDSNIVRHGLSLFETSSPSYVLLASIDECLRYALENFDEFDRLNKNLEDFYKKTKALKNIKTFHFDDLGKILISAHDGFALAKALREKNIETELASEKYVLAMATVVDGEDSLNILKKALFELDALFCHAEESREKIIIPTKSKKIGETLNETGAFLNYKEALGKISCEYIWAYPPGVPIVVPGEIFSQELIDFLNKKKYLKSTRARFPEIYVK